MGRFVIGFLCLCFSASVPAEIYKWVDEEGHVVYSDRPREGAEEVDLPPLSTYKSRRPSALPAPPPKEAAKPLYERFRVAKPAQDDTIWDNTGNVEVRLDLVPGLNVQAGHRIRLYLDGQPVGRLLAGASARFTNVDRGTHTVHAAVVDSQGKTLIATKPVTFHLKRASILQPSRRPPSAP